MSKSSPVSDLRGASRLAIDLTLLVADIVETMHHNIARRPGLFEPASPARTTGITGFVYRRIRGTTRLVGELIDAALAPLASRLPHVADPPGRDAVVCALNGVLGDHLAATANPLAIDMHLRVAGTPIALTREAITHALPAARNTVVVLVHGLCLSDAAWLRDGHDHGRGLARDLGADAVYLRYNTGRHISTSGAALADVLAALQRVWPVELRELILVGHSMGGLVIRAACATAAATPHGWVDRVRGLVFLGTPHLGAPLERKGHGVDLILSASPYTAALARLGQLRSAGITDLRHGSVRDDDWQDRDRFGRDGYCRHPQPLPRGVPALAIAGSLSKSAPASGRSARGDGLVPVASALGLHEDAAWRLELADAGREIAYATGHLDLLASAQVYDRMLQWLRAYADVETRTGVG